MESEYGKLRKISGLLTEILKQEAAKSTLPAQIKELTARVEKEKNRYLSLNSRIEKQNEDLSASKNALADEQSKLAESNEKLSSISTNREYDAVHTEIIVHTEKIQELEEHVHQVEEAVASAISDVEPFKKSYEEAQETLQPRIDQLQSELASVDEKIAVLEKESDEQKALLAKATLQYFERLLASKLPRLKSGKQKGIISEIRRGDSNCSICRTNITNRKLQALRRGSSLQFCDLCGSILLPAEEVFEQTSED